jgi:hypothetical protein
MRAADRVSVWFNNMDVDQLFFLGSMPAVTYEGSGQAPKRATLALITLHWEPTSLTTDPVALSGSLGSLISRPA